MAILLLDRFFFYFFQTQDWESMFQSKIIPIPQFPPTDPVSKTFVGRLAQEILRVTDPRLVIYFMQFTCKETFTEGTLLAMLWLKQL